MNMPGTNFTWRQPRELRISYRSSKTRHDAISFFKEMFVPIYETFRVTMGWDDADVSPKAFLVQSAMENSCFVLVSAAYREFSV